MPGQVKLQPGRGLSGIVCEGDGVTSAASGHWLEKITHGAGEERRSDRAGWRFASIDIGTLYPGRCSRPPIRLHTQLSAPLTTLPIPVTTSDRGGVYRWC